MEKKYKVYYPGLPNPNFTFMFVDYNPTNPMQPSPIEQIKKKILIIYGIEVDESKLTFEEIFFS